MPNINIDLDEAACAEIMRRYQLPTKAEAINLALRKLANEPSPFIPPTANACPLEEILAHAGHRLGRRPGRYAIQGDLP